MAPRDRAVSIYSFVDANHAGNFLKRLSYTGIIFFIKNAPIIWFNKKQNTYEADIFVIYLVALRVFKYLIVALRYKLLIFGVRL